MMLLCVLNNLLHVMVYCC